MPVRTANRTNLLSRQHEVFVALPNSYIRDSCFPYISLSSSPTINLFKTSIDSILLFLHLLRSTLRTTREHTCVLFFSSRTLVFQSFFFAFLFLFPLRSPSSEPYPPPHPSSRSSYLFLLYSLILYQSWKTSKLSADRTCRTTPS